MNKYECIFICANDVPTEKTAQITDRVKTIITGQKGEIAAVDQWGKKRLAYPIAGNHEGSYVFFDFIAPPDTVAKIENYLKLVEGVIRHMIIRKVVKKRFVKPQKSQPAAGVQVSAAVTEP